MNLQQIETFVRVAEVGSFSKAAVLLDTAQPALSRQVRALETELRETLLIRTGRGVTLTDAKGNVAKVTTADLKASNGVIHVVDKVLMP